MTLTVQDLVFAAKQNVQEISVERLHALQSLGLPIIDVREPAEFANGHVPGAINIPRGLLEFEVDGHPAVNCVRDSALSHRGQPVILYCRSGGRSALAADALRRLGFVMPLSLEGGFNAWLAAEEPTSCVVSP
jgi:rhodanese-related sulfurtransferase